MLSPPKVSYPHPSHLLLLVKTHGLSMNLFEILQRNRSLKNPALICSSLWKLWLIQAGFVSSVGKGDALPLAPAWIAMGALCTGSWHVWVLGLGASCWNWQADHLRFQDL